jgi:hypothetical protein
MGNYKTRAASCCGRIARPAARQRTWWPTPLVLGGWCRDRDRDREQRGAARAPWASVPGSGVGAGVGDDVGDDVDVYAEMQMGKSRSMAFLAISDGWGCGHGARGALWGWSGAARRRRRRRGVRPGQGRGQGQGEAAMQARGRTSKNNIDSERASRRADTSLIGQGRVEMGWRG